MDSGPGQRYPAIGEARAGRRRRRGGGPPAFAKFDEGWQEAGKRLAGTGRRDQEGRTAGKAMLQQGELVRTRLPAAAVEPAAHALGESLGRRVFARHASEVAPMRTGVETDGETDYI